MPDFNATGSPALLSQHPFVRLIQGLMQQSPGATSQPAAAPTQSSGYTGFWTTLGRALGSVGRLPIMGIKSGFDALSGLGGAQPASGVTRSVGGWNIDANGNLVSAAGSPGNQNIAALSNPFSHTVTAGGASAMAMGTMANIKRRNQL